MTNLPQVASVASVKVTSAITILIHIIKAGMEASANSSNPSPSNCQRILPRLLPMAMRKSNLAATVAGTEPESSHQPDEYIENEEYYNEPCTANVWSYSFSSIPFYFLFFVALYVEKIEWSDLQLRCHILIKQAAKLSVSASGRIRREMNGRYWSL